MLAHFCNGFFASLGMFSTLPAPRIAWDDKATRFLIPCFPLVGAILGGLWYAAGVLLRLWQPPILVGAALLCLVPFFLTGFLHVDGLMDVADAIGSRRDRAEKLKILKDSHTGAFGAAAMAVLLLLHFAAVESLLQEQKSLLVFVFIPIFSRCVCGVLVLTMPLIFEKGYAAGYRQNGVGGAVIWLCILGSICIGVAFWLGGLAVVWPLVALLVGALLCAAYCRSQLGGISGDVSGCALCVGEVCALLCAAVI